MSKPFIKIPREHLNRVTLCRPDVNGIIAYEYSYNWHNYPVYVHSLGIVNDQYFFMIPGKSKQLHVQIVTHNEDAPDTTTESIFTFAEEMDVNLFLLDILDGDKAPVARFNPEITQCDTITQLDYC